MQFYNTIYAYGLKKRFDLSTSIAYYHLNISKDKKTTCFSREMSKNTNVFYRVVFVNHIQTLHTSFTQD